MKLGDIGWVSAQMVLGVGLLLIPSEGRWFAEPWGLACEWGAWIIAGGVLLVAALNLGKALTPTPTPKAGVVMVTKGLYGIVRHPMYSVILLASWLYTLPSVGPGRWAFALAITVFFNLKARREEGFLCSMYEGYAGYMKQVPRFLPKLFRGQKPPQASQ